MWLATVDFTGFHTSTSVAYFSISLMEMLLCSGRGFPLTGGYQSCNGSLDHSVAVDESHMRNYCYLMHLYVNEMNNTCNNNRWLG